MAFIAMMILAGWIIRPVESMTLKQDEIYGPKGVDFDKCKRVYPRIYSPSAGLAPDHRQRSEEPNAAYPDDGEFRSGTAYPDDGEFRSDTATQNAAYMNVFTYQPFLSGEFPLPEGPPEPYLNDFSRIHQ